MKLSLVLVTAALVAASAAIVQVAPAATPKTATVVIRHQVRGCHTWSFAGGPFKAALVVRIARGGTITFINDDVMPQKVFQKGGPAVRYAGSPAMNHMGASVKVSFAKGGVYSLATKAGEDYSYVKNAKTIGEDNTLTIKVTVT